MEGLVRVIDNPPSGNADWNPSQPDASSSSAPYKIYNIGNNSPVNLMDFIEAIEDELGLKATMELQPLQPGDVPATYADVANLEKELGYKPATTIKEGIKHFINWYKKYYKIS